MNKTVPESIYRSIELLLYFIISEKQITSGKFAGMLIRKSKAYLLKSH